MVFGLISDKRKEEKEQLIKRKVEELKDKFRKRCSKEYGGKVVERNGSLVCIVDKFVEGKTIKIETLEGLDAVRIFDRTKREVFYDTSYIWGKIKLKDIESLEYDDDTKSLKIVLKKPVKIKIKGKSEEWDEEKFKDYAEWGYETPTIAFDYEKIEVE